MSKPPQSTQDEAGFPKKKDKKSTKFSIVPQILDYILKQTCTPHLDYRLWYPTPPQILPNLNDSFDADISQDASLTPNSSTTSSLPSTQLSTHTPVPLHYVTIFQMIVNFAFQSALPSDQLAIFKQYLVKYTSNTQVQQTLLKIKSFEFAAIQARKTLKQLNVLFQHSTSSLSEYQSYQHTSFEQLYSHIDKCSRKEQRAGGNTTTHPFSTLFSPTYTAFSTTIYQPLSQPSLFFPSDHPQLLSSGDLDTDSLNPQLHHQTSPYSGSTSQSTLTPIPRPQFHPHTPHYDSPSTIFAPFHSHTFSLAYLESSEKGFIQDLLISMQELFREYESYLFDYLMIYFPNFPFYNLQSTSHPTYTNLRPYSDSLHALNKNRNAGNQQNQRKEAKESDRLPLPKLLSFYEFINRNLQVDYLSQTATTPQYTELSWTAESVKIASQQSTDHGHAPTTPSITIQSHTTPHTQPNKQVLKSGKPVSDDLPDLGHQPYITPLMNAACTLNSPQVEALILLGAYFSHEMTPTPTDFPLFTATLSTTPIPATPDDAGLESDQFGPNGNNDDQFGPDGHSAAALLPSQKYIFHPLSELLQPFISLTMGINSDDMFGGQNQNGDENDASKDYCDDDDDDDDDDDNDNDNAELAQADAKIYKPSESILDEFSTDFDDSPYDIEPAQFMAALTMLISLLCRYGVPYQLLTQLPMNHVHPLIKSILASNAIEDYSTNQSPNNDKKQPQKGKGTKNPQTSPNNSKSTPTPTSSPQPQMVTMTLMSLYINTTLYYLDAWKLSLNSIEFFPLDALELLISLDSKLINLCPGCDFHPVEPVLPFETRIKSNKAHIHHLMPSTSQPFISSHPCTNHSNVHTQSSNNQSSSKSSAQHRSQQQPSPSAFTIHNHYTLLEILLSYPYIDSTIVFDILLQIFASLTPYVNTHIHPILYISSPEQQKAIKNAAIMQNCTETEIAEQILSNIPITTLSDYFSTKQDACLSFLKARHALNKELKQREDELFGPKLTTPISTKLPGSMNQNEDPDAVRQNTKAGQMVTLYMSFQLLRSMHFAEIELKKITAQQAVKIKKNDKANLNNNGINPTLDDIDTTNDADGGDVLHLDTSQLQHSSDKSGDNSEQVDADGGVKFGRYDAFSDKFLTDKDNGVETSTNNTRPFTVMNPKLFEGSADNTADNKDDKEEFVEDERHIIPIAPPQPQTMEDLDNPGFKVVTGRLQAETDNSDQTGANAVTPSTPSQESAPPLSNTLFEQHLQDSFDYTNFFRYMALHDVISSYDQYNVAIGNVELGADGEPILPSHAIFNPLSSRPETQNSSSSEPRDTSTKSAEASPFVNTPFSAKSAKVDEAHFMTNIMKSLFSSNLRDTSHRKLHKEEILEEVAALHKIQQQHDLMVQKKQKYKQQLEVQAIVKKTHDHMSRLQSQVLEQQQLENSNRDKDEATSQEVNIESDEDEEATNTTSSPQNNSVLTQNDINTFTAHNKLVENDDMPVLKEVDNMD